ncbi:hypothetical protein IFM89_013100 [Coptis chinensis]|uniref:DYW domain-containing protein n=1 Tax=Coptis chinensis TaxID=261450 RepID=A0A835M5J5_9MAGN|nr:hypothetical protein IFM89_013100 [Coptis chinensis]
MMHRNNNLLCCPRNGIVSIFGLNLSFSSSTTFSPTPASYNNYDDDDEDLVRSCDNLNVLKRIHSSLLTSGLITYNNPHLAGQVISNYSKLGDLIAARSVFNATAGPNSFLWNTMIRAYANNHHPTQTLQLYLLMRRNCVGPNNYTFPFVLKACGSRSVAEGRSVHSDVIRTGFDSHVFVQAALVDMYAKCGQTDDARWVFDGLPVRDLVCWTAMITAYEQSDRPEEALMLFHAMQAKEKFVADSVALVSVASAVAQLGDARMARSVHAYATRNNFVQDVFVDNSIVAMYAKSGNLEEAKLVFDQIKEKDGISWNSMLSGYVQNGRASEALSLFEKMLVCAGARARSNPVTALIMVSACAYLGSPHLAKELHHFVINSRVAIDTTLWNAILDMYAKCGNLDTAIQMFRSRLPIERNGSSWNVMISGYGMHGGGKEAFQLYEEMVEQGFDPNHITFTSLLSACSHSGLIEEGRKCFYDMKKHSVVPEVKHYACMVDMLGRAGYLDEALGLINKMPSEPNDGVWGALLLACRIHGNTELGELAAKNLFQLEPEHTGYYVLMSNIYAASSQWQEVRKLRQDMKSKRLKKPAAFSVIEVGKEVHGFHTADHTHPHFTQVYVKVETIVAEIKMAGYIPDGTCVLHDVEEEDKDHSLKTHSEKLAVAFGIMKIDPGLPIQVTMNLRICNDCHSAFKFISNIYQRKVIVRDANRFHHFQEDRNGSLVSGKDDHQTSKDLFSWKCCYNLPGKDAKDSTGMIHYNAMS